MFDEDCVIAQFYIIVCIYKPDSAFTIVLCTVLEMALPADSAATSGRLSTVVLLWRQAAEFAVDVVDAGVAAVDDRSAGHLDVLVRRVPAGGCGRPGNDRRARIP